MAFLPFSPPLIGEEEIAEVVDTLRSGWISTGPKTKLFEAEFAQFVGAPAALGVNSCTAALHLALLCHGIGPGDEVITTPMTFCATANVIEHVGATLVLADIEPDTLNIGPAQVETAITPRTRAIIPVHYAGHPVDMVPLCDLAARHGLHIIEDAAHALPAHYRGEMIGRGAHLTAFSFYATKNITTAEGGMLVGDPALIEEAQVLSLHGMNRDAWQRYGKGASWHYDVMCPGWKYNMTDIQASLGMWQLRKLPGFHQRRREVVQAYNEAFADHEALELPVTRPDVEHAWHLYPIRIRPEALREGRDHIIEELATRNIGTSVHFIPIHLHPYYREKYGFQPGDFPVAYSNYLRLISLPLNAGMTDGDVDDVIAAVLDILDQHGA